MKQIPLTQGYFSVVNDDDYEFLMQWKWHAVIEESGRICAVRNSPSINGRSKLLYMHRIILDAPGDKVVDHKNGNALDNQRSNLRICTQAENVRNRGKARNNSSGFCGVSKNGKGLQAKIGLNGKEIYLGTFPTPEQAAEAYDRAAMIHHGEFARLNFPEKKLVYAVENLIGFEPGKK